MEKMIITIPFRIYFLPIISKIPYQNSCSFNEHKHLKQHLAPPPKKPRMLLWISAFIVIDFSLNEPYIYIPPLKLILDGFCKTNISFGSAKWQMFNKPLKLSVFFQVDGVSYLLQEIYGIENKYNSQESKARHHLHSQKDINANSAIIYITKKHQYSNCRQCLVVVTPHKQLHINLK